MNRLASVAKRDDIFPQYLDTPTGMLLEYHNLGRLHNTYDSAQLLIGTCIDSRININMPARFSFVIRAGGANMRFSEFFISFALATASIRHFALIGHNNCLMRDLKSQKDPFIRGLINFAGADKEYADKQYRQSVPIFEIGNEVDFILNETGRLRQIYPKVQIAPLMYLVDDNRLYLIKE
jgi:carbonic anhydrase